MFRRRSAIIVLMLIAMTHLVACQSDPERIGFVGPTSRATTTATAAMSDIPAAPADFQGIQALVFESLFDYEYDPAHFTYDLADSVTGEGSYVGNNQFGDLFELEVVFHGPIALEDLGLAQDELAEAQAADMHYASVLAWIRTSNAEFAVSGASFDAVLPDQGFQSRFMVTGIEDPQSEAFSPTPPPDASLSRMPDLLPPIVGMDSGIEPMDACRQACFDEHDAAVESAQSDYQSSVKAAEAEYDAAADAADSVRTKSINDAWKEYESEKRSAKLGLGAELAACHVTLVGGIVRCSTVGGFLGIFTGGLALAACLVVAHASYAYCTADAIGSYNDALATASSNRNTRIDTANTRYELSIAQAQQTLLAALEAAKAAHDAALAAAKAALLECLNRCRQERTAKDTLLERR